MSYIPTVGGVNASGFSPQFPHSWVDHISLGTTLIEQLSNDGLGTTVGHASGFFWRHNSALFLVTARHVLSGLNPFSDKAMSTSGFIPRRFRVHGAVEAAPDKWTRRPAVIERKSGDFPAWLEDPEFATLRTDIAAIEITEPHGFRVACLNDIPDIDADLFSLVGFECAIVGYPQAKVGGAMTPVWRRGTIASEPLLAVDGKPMFLLDASTSPGFSGSPVLRRHIGPLPVREPDGSISVDVGNIVKTTFVGVYAGRLSHSHYGGEVPFVFYGNRLPIILEQAGPPGATHITVPAR